jgi:oligogalacturonide lyase
MTTDSHTRRSFLGSAAAGALLSASGRPVYATSGTPQDAGSGSTAKKAAGRVQRINSEIREFRDPDTGARVRQLTGDGSDNVHLYFTSECFVAGSDRMVFGSNRTGRFQLYLLEIREARLTQLTSTEGNIDPQQSCASRNGRVFYFEGPALHSLRLDTLEDRELYRVPRGFEPRLLSCTANGDYVAFAYGEELNVSTESGRIYSTMAETYYQRPRCVIMRIEASTGNAVAAWGEPMWISHVLIHPTQPDLILFCHEGGSFSLQRMWTINVGAERGRKAEPLYIQKPNEYCVHEYFTRSGEIGFQYEVDREGHREYYNCFIRPDGTWLRQVLLPGPRPEHIQSNTANTLVVGDCGYLSPDDKQGRMYMSLMTAANGRANVRRLCRRQPGNTQHSHGHPVFSLDDKWVVFNSRIGERDNIFMADVESI